MIRHRILDAVYFAFLHLSFLASQWSCHALF
uniref:Uncharacterized protein n=1 Tax=Anguilla anguilla TaxID=7936 RepID=A0A0E9XPF7_ANGAN